jgi:hypothetical protein
MHAIVCALFAFFSHCVTWHIHVHCVHMNVMSPHVHCAHRVGGIGTCLCPLPACPYMQWHVGHRQGIGRVRIQYASHTWRRCPRFLGQGRLGRSTHPPSSPVQNGVLCPFLNAPNVDKPTALALAIAGVAHMGAAALPLLLRWTSMNTGWDPMTRASEGVSLHRSASMQGGKRIPPCMRPPQGPFVRARPYGRPPRRSVVVPVWLPVRLPGCSRQP